jgi:hypothetical protein
LEFSRYYCGVAATGNGWFLTIRERASTPPFTQEVLVAGALSAAAAAAGGVGGMDFGAWRTSYEYVVASEYVTARLRRH